MTRRGGHVVLFGVKNGDAIIEDYHRIIMNGLQLHGIVGRRIFDTWKITQALLEDTSNGIQQAIWEVILNRGEDTMSNIASWDKETFEGQISRNPKVVIQFAG
jgi:threonine 3-dehydrogenase